MEIKNLNSIKNWSPKKKPERIREENNTKMTVNVFITEYFVAKSIFEISFGEFL